ncbi:sulfite exporter TauE/SafE family protein [Alkalimarinus sediminis]|uniref:Probable membrane transporter protein n=1 Tax=Alkalimarinus sediminis TaxID=1632866 RepID=A0A9E8HMD4_9ALTE|nr:sulfite exporter TauE/SafE family protein [Alkalimarinus sediminis]UZW75303.1 sulfite exporter TauE/SafE family protein [Alkalimarinus sediminis]
MDVVLEQTMLFVISLAANGLSALAGGGAGLLQLPALLFLGLAFGTALATHKIASVALGVGATFRHIREKSIDPRFAGFILLTGLPGVVLGALVILAVPDDIARLVLGVFTAGLGIYSWRSPQLGLTSAVKHRDLLGWCIGGLGLFFIGFLNGSITSGTGLFVTIWLVVWFGFDYQRAVTYTLILVGLFWNGFGAVTLALQTEVKWEWIPALILGALLGGYFGAHLSIAKGSRLVKRSFECVTVAVGASLIIDGLI